MIARFYKSNTLKMLGRKKNLKMFVFSNKTLGIFFINSTLNFLKILAQIVGNDSLKITIIKKWPTQIPKYRDIDRKLKKNCGTLSWYQL